MRYRRLGRTGRDISVVSLGCMRFPGEEEALAVVKRSVELGINYLETSLGYCGGRSEVWVGRALEELGRADPGGAGDARAKVMVSTKSRASDAEGLSVATWARRNLEQSLENLQTDYVDFYHIWSVNNEEQYETCVRGGWLDAVRKARDEGLVRHIGVTSHATPKLVERIVDDGHFEALTVQYSLLLQSYRPVVARAREKGMGVVLMGPLAGGLLGTPSQALSRAFAPDDQITGALRYVLSDPGVSSAASGMRSVEEVETNCAVADALPDDLEMTYQDGIGEKIRSALGDGLGAKLDEFERFLCGGCRYCVNACPEGIRAFKVFRTYNGSMLGVEPADPGKVAASAEAIREKCTLCGSCREICPQGIYVPEHLERVADFYRAAASGDLD